jgi:glycosyltransferase involved in cell wall biosynthesis
MLSAKQIVSIITVCLNSQDLIERTVQSVISQDYPHIEYIVIDGGSLDHTMDVLHTYKTKIAVLVSEKDNGIYDAMNKGLRNASGNLVYFLNSGDYLASASIISQIVEVVGECPDDDIFSGDFFYYDNQGAQRCSGNRKDEIDLLARVINHQAIIARKEVFSNYGLFDTRYRIYADYDWLLRAVVKHGCRLKYTGIPFAFYLKAGRSDMVWRKYLNERQEILMKYSTARQMLRYFLRYPADGIRYFLNRSRGLFLIDS